MQQKNENLKKPYHGRVAPYLGKPTIFINDLPVYPLIYSLTDVPGGRWSWEEVPQHNLRQFTLAGCRLFQVDLFLEHIWYEDGTFDLTTACRLVRGVLDACPEAAVFIRFHVNAPKWWIGKYPEEAVVYADTEYEPDREGDLNRLLQDDQCKPFRYSLASEKWLQEITIQTIRFCREYPLTPEGEAVVGIQVAGGVYGEWHYWGFNENEPDIGPAMTTCFRKWLKTKYGNDSSLQKAWHNSQVTLTTAMVPGVKERRESRAGIFRDPAVERNIIDYYQCQHQVVADTIVHFCRVVKENWPRPVITGTFYGYFFSVFGREAAGGHLELHRVLESPYVDYLSGPQAYYPESGENCGEPYRSRSLVTSCRLAGKLWLDEMDREPKLPLHFKPEFEALLTGEIANVRRNVLFTFSKGMGLWFYDFGAAGINRVLDRTGSGGWWDYPRMLKSISKLHSWLEKTVHTPYCSDADVLMVYDTTVFYHLLTGPVLDPVSHVVVNWNSLAAFHSGVVFDPIHLRDLAKVDLAAYKVVVFNNTFRLNEEERRFIREKVAADGRQLVWFYAPGYIDGSGEDRLDSEAISATTGISVAPVTLKKAPEIEVKGLDGPSFSYKISDEPFSPLFHVTDPDVKSYGVYAGTNKTAIARKELSGSVSWYIALPSYDIRLMTGLLQNTGAHRYTTTGEIFYAANGVLVMHGKEGGEKEVALRNGKKVTLDLPKEGYTIILDGETGEGQG